MIKELKILADHGKQYVPDLRKQPVSGRFRGRPEISADIGVEQAGQAAILCPTGAIDRHSGAIDLGQVTHFPPTVTLKYRWTNFGQFEPYVGAGVNFTSFIDSEPPAGLHVEYDSSVGPALQAGVDYRIDEHWGVNLDVRRIWINTDVAISGAITANDEVDINPWVVSTSIAYRF